MRALTIALVLVLTGCAAASPQRERSDPTGGRGYNRREIPPTDGLFSGPDGVFTIYRRDSEARSKEDPAPAEP